MWKDLWLDDVLADSHPRVFSYAKLEDISVRDFLGCTNLNETFHLPLSMQAHNELRDIQEITTHIGNDAGEDMDSWVYEWGSEIYTAKDTTNSIFERYMHINCTSGSGRPGQRSKLRSLGGFFSLTA